MKPILCITFFFITLSLSAQDFYINLQTGYGFATEAGQANYTDIEFVDNVEVQEIVAGGFGEGIYFRGNLGYQHSEFIAVEFGLNYLLGRTITTEEKRQEHGPGGALFIASTTSRNLNALIFTPQLVVLIPTTSTVKPYIKTGLAFGTFMKAKFEEAYNTDNNMFIQIDRNTENSFDGGTPLGFIMALGAKSMVSETVAFTIDFNLLNMTYRPHTGTVTKFEENGSNELENLTIREREIIFNNKIENNSSVTPDENEPLRALPISLPMSNVTFNIGLQIDL